MLKKPYLLLIITTLFTLIFFQAVLAETDPLPSWNNGKVKQSIVELVQTVTDKNNVDYVPPKDRFATFDNDGTLWVEQPMYTQMVFMKNRFNEKLPNLDETYALPSFPINIEDYTSNAKQWLASAEHPRYHRHYTDLVYQPMLEVMQYLRDNGFTVYIVSGGGQDFIRSFAEEIYGITPDHVIGSTSQSEFSHENNKTTMTKTRKLLFISDKEGKPEAIHLFIGKKPLIAFGNSNGDQQMLEWVQSGTGKRLMLLVHHDDAKREYTYDTESKIGTFSTELMQEAENNRWQIISMKNDWKVVFPYEK